MKLTEKDVRMFKALNKSEMGKQLVDYLDRLQADLCDVRKFPIPTGSVTPQADMLALIVSNQMAAKAIQDNICDKIKLQHESKKKIVEDYV